MPNLAQGLGGCPMTIKIEPNPAWRQKSQHARGRDGICTLGGGVDTPPHKTTHGWSMISFEV